MERYRGFSYTPYPNTRIAFPIINIIHENGTFFFFNQGWTYIRDFPGGSDSKASAYNAGDPSLVPGSGRSPGGGNGNPLQYSRLENPMDGGTW